MNRLVLDRRRNVTLANYNRHFAGEMHPDRTMAEHDLVCILEGTWAISQEGVVYPLEPGDVILLHAGLAHAGASPCPTDVRTMFVHLSRLPEDAFEPEPPQYEPAEHRVDLPVIIQRCDSASMLSLFEDIVHTFWSDEVMKTAKLGALADLLLIRLQEQSQGNRDRDTYLVADVLLRIRRETERFHTLGELAAAAHLSTRALTAKFRKTTGTSPHRYEQDLKLEMARRMLLDQPERTLREVACSFGFYDEFHFSRLFKRKFGIPPSKAVHP